MSIETRGSITLDNWAFGVAWSRLWGRIHIFIQILCFNGGFVFGEWDSDSIRILGSGECLDCDEIILKRLKVEASDLGLKLVTKTDED